MKKTIFILIVSILLLSSFTSATIDLTEDLFAGYNADIDGNFEDVLLTNNGTINGATFTSDGKINGSYNFDGINDYIILGTNNLIGTGTNPMSVSLWLNSTQILEGADNWHSIINLKQTTQFQANLNYVGNVQHMQFGFRGSNLAVDYTITSDYDSAWKNDWVHFVFSYNGGAKGSASSYDLYVNGVLYTTGKVNTIIGSTGTNNVLGIDKDLSGSPLNATIDAIYIYSGVELNTTEITALYNLGEGLQYPFPIPPLTIINSTLNMTSEGGCIAWRTNKSVSCITTDGTPTTIFDTNLNADCSVRTQVHNYSSSFNCSTTGSKSHVCTVYDTDKLDFGLNSIVASCDAGSGNNDTTGAMSINMTAGGVEVGLVDCISVVGAGCGVVITDNCAIIS